MKRLLCMLCFAVAAWGALPAGAQWEVRTTGSDLNGGFFNTAGGSGTDYSQQNAAQLSVTDGVTATTTLSSVTGGFTSVMIHNGVQISGGSCAAGFYEITGFTSSNSVTIDRTGGTGTGCTVKVGGGLLTIGAALSHVVWLGGVTHNGVWIKSGTYTITSTLTTPAGAYNITGYQTTHGDNGTKPLITTATNSTTLITNDNSGRPLLQNLLLSNTAATRSFGIDTPGGFFLVATNVIFDGFSNAIRMASNGTEANPFYGSSLEIKNSTLAGVLLSTSTARTFFCSGCYIHNNTGAGISDAGGSSLTVVLVNSVLSNNGASGVSVVSGSDVVMAESCDFVSNTGSGILGAGAVVQSFNSAFYGNSTYGISQTAPNLPSAGFGLSNAYGANGTAATLNFPAGTGDITLTANPFTSSTNFALNNTAGGGAALKGAGFPGALIGGTTTGYPDVGAVQSAGGGGQVGYSFVQ